jgi:hypothetical protein
MSGNMGDGWTDEHEAARAFADYLERAFRRHYPSVDVEITVQYASGHKHNTVCVCDESDIGEISDGDLHAVESQAWEDWCRSDEAEAYMSNKDDE